MLSTGSAVKNAFLPLALVGCMIVVSESFQVCSLSSLRISNLRRAKFSSSPIHNRRIDTKMVYTPPRSGVTLEELKEQLDRQIAIPSPPSRESPKVGVPRSPCTSLYGNWRPTTGTEPWRSGSSHTRVSTSTTSKSTVKDSEVREKRARGRPPVEPKPAVKPELLVDFVSRAAAVLRTNAGKMDSNLFGQHWKIVHPDAPLYEFKSNKAYTIHQMLRESGDFFVVSETERQKVKMFELNENAVQKFLEESKLNASKVSDDSAAYSETEDLSAFVEEISSQISPKSVPQESVEYSRSDVRTTAAAEPMRVRESETVYSEVPVHGKARMSSHDRRLRVKTVAAVRTVQRTAEDDLPAAPRQMPNDALQRPVISLYNSWAVDGRDVVMEVTHSGSFEEMMALVASDRESKGVEFTAIDMGCGNGWAARRLAAHPLCSQVTGVDGAALMIAKAESMDIEGAADYVIGDARKWVPTQPADVVMAQELLYLVDDPKETVTHLVENCVAPGGRFIAALDCFKENKASQSWAEDLGVPMHCLTEAVWRRIFKEAGLSGVESWRSKSGGPWQGTLIVTGVRH